MGQTLSFPATNKVSEVGGNDYFHFGVSEMQGWRTSMEDAHAIVLDLDKERGISNSFFAVYDGHGGGTVAKFAGQNVHKRLVEEGAYQQGEYKAAMKRAFLGTDEDLLADPSHTRDPSGCTAVAALITTDGKIYVANAGDSRSVISVKGEVKPLSFDHKPTNDTEKQRIVDAGGYIEYGRVNGNLALSRALGDFEFKKNYKLPPEQQIVTADPDITVHEMSDEDEFLVLACDGIWDCLSSQQAVDFVRRQVAEGKELSEVCENICEHCLAPDTSPGAGIGCDNMTMMVIAILHGRTKEEWYQWITDRVNKSYGFITPATPPRIYSQARLDAFRTRREARGRRQQQPSDDETPTPFPRILRFMPRSAGPLMFAGFDNSEEEENNGDVDGISSLTETLALDQVESSDPSKYIRSRLDELEQRLREGGGADVDDLDATMDDESDSDGLLMEDILHFAQPEALDPPKFWPNGDASTSPVEQLQSQPHGDEVLPVVKAEGLIDSSDDPLLGP